MNLYRAPFMWVLSSETTNVDRLLQEMEKVGRRGEAWDCERDPKGLVKFGFATETIQSCFLALLRSKKAATDGHRAEARGAAP